MSDKVFVFVACGEDRHIATLNFSLPYLRRFSKNRILVVTDPKRNRLPIAHGEVIAADTPRGLDHKRAAIFLKTSLHRILDPKNLYCYLDSDIIALRKGVDKVFDHLRGPVTFADDHGTLALFSPHAMQCGCLEQSRERTRLLRDLLQEYGEFLGDDPVLLEEKKKHDRLMRRYRFVMGHPAWGRLPGRAQKIGKGFYARLFRRFVLRNRYVWVEAERRWLDHQGRVLFDERRYADFRAQVQALCGFSFDVASNTWVDSKGKNVYDCRCGHLAEAVRRRFNVAITDPEWVHPNGGVFVFGKDARPFLDTWHGYCLEVFSDPAWAARDQGALAAAIWKFGLQNQERLPSVFNFLVDYHDSRLIYRGGLKFGRDGKKETWAPFFAHVFHEFGNRNWKVWQDVEKLLPRKG